MATLNLVGNPNLSRRDILRKINGTAVYSFDINPAHIGLSANTPQDQYMLFMGMIVCPYSHAKILSIDTSKAEAAGYLTLTAEDLPPWQYWSTTGRQYTPLPLAGRDEVLYPGQCVACVAAPTTDLVEDAAALVDIQYEVLPFVLDQEEALKPTAPVLWPGGTNYAVGGFTNETGPIPATIHWERGNVQEALKNAAHTIGYPDQVRLDTQLEAHYQFEPFASTARWVSQGANTIATPTGAATPIQVAPAPNATGTATFALGDVLYLWAHTQYPHSDRTGIANYFGIPINNVIMSTGLGENTTTGAATEGGAVMGMALGDNSGQPWPALTAAMARKAGVGMAVKFGPTRRNQVAMMTHRFPNRAYVSLGMDSNGNFTAMKWTIYINVGAYGGSEGSDGVSDLLNLYDVPNALVDVYSVNTNAYRIASSMRDVGESQGHFLMERAVDLLCQAGNVDPYQFRLQNIRTRKNAVDPTSINTIDSTQQTGNPYSGWGLPEALIEPATAFGWESNWQGWGKVNLNGQTLTGIGLASHNGAKGSPSAPATAQVTLNANGGITCYTGLTDHGAGGNTTYAIMVGEAMGMLPSQFSQISLVLGDTSLTTDSGVTAGSRSTRSGGLAMIAAVQNLGTVVFPTVATALSKSTGTTITAAQLEWANGGVYQIGNPSVGMTLSQAAALFTTPPKGYGSYTFPTNVAYRVGGAKFFELSVDIETAQVQVQRFFTGMDIGRVIFYKGAMSQANGGLFMAGGESLTQERWNDPTTGMDINPNFHDFRIFTIYEIPQEILSNSNGPANYMNGTNHKWVEYVDPIGPFGAKGIGENVMMAVSPAFVNALTNALGGYPGLTSLPVTRDKVVAGLQWMQSKGMIPAGTVVAGAYPEVYVE